MVLAMVPATFGRKHPFDCGRNQGYHGPATLRPQSLEEALTVPRQPAINYPAGAVDGQMSVSSARQAWEGSNDPERQPDASAAQ
jgi:hypothetical protein